MDNAPDNADITQLLIAWSDGRREALDDLMPIVYADLRRVAAGYMRREAAGHALQPTALVHEAYVRLVDQKQVKWRNRAHFFGVAAGLMRRILVDHARRRRAEKRGGDWERVTLAGDEVAADSPQRNRCSGTGRSARTTRAVRSSTRADRRASVLRRPDDRGNGRSRRNLCGNCRARVDDRQGVAAGGHVAVRLTRSFLSVRGRPLPPYARVLWPSLPPPS